MNDENKETTDENKKANVKPPNLVKWILAVVAATVLIIIGVLIGSQ